MRTQVRLNQKDPLGVGPFGSLLIIQAAKGTPGSRRPFRVCAGVCVC